MAGPARGRRAVRHRLLDANPDGGASGGAGDRKARHLRGGGPSARAAAGRHLPVRGVPRDGDRRHHPGHQSSPTPGRERASNRPAAISPWRRSWGHRGTTRCPTTSGTHSRASATTSLGPASGRPGGDRHAGVDRRDGSAPCRRPPAEPLDTPRILRRTLHREHLGRDHEKDQALPSVPPRRRGGTRGRPPRRSGHGPVPRQANRHREDRVPARWPRPSAEGSCGSPWPGFESTAAAPRRPENRSRGAAGATPDRPARLGPLPGGAGDNPLVFPGELHRVGEGAPTLCSGHSTRRATGRSGTATSGCRCI